MPSDSSPNFPSDGRVDALLRDWDQRARLALFAYNGSANRCLKWHARIGGLAAILAAIAGTSVFASLGDDVDPTARVAVAVVSLLASVLAGIQAFAQLPQRAEEYERAARRFGAVRREIEQARLFVPSDLAECQETLDRLRRALDDAADQSVQASERVWIRMRRHVKGEYTRRERWLNRVRGLPELKPLSLSQNDRDDGAPPT